jgi:periplasmic protein TonB
MFELLEEESHRPLWQTILYLSISIASHLIVLLLLLTVPLIFLRASSIDELLAFLIEPPPPPSYVIPPPPPPLDFASAIIKARTLAMPKNMPTFIPPPVDEPNPIDILRGVFPKRIWEMGEISGWPKELSKEVLTRSLPIAPAPPVPIRRVPIVVGGNVQEAKLINKVLPVYPQLALKTRVSGTVVIQAIIDEVGRVESIEVVEGHPLLVEAAVAAIKEWRYSPTLLNGEPLPVSAKVTVIFTLR